MLKNMSIRRRLNLPDIFKGLHLRNETEKSRSPYDAAFIQSRFFSAARFRGSTRMRVLSFM